MSRGSHGCVALIAALSSGACLIAPNPQFIDANAGESEDTGDSQNSGGSEDPLGCEDGFADCDGEPGCEASLDDPETCGSCSKSCEIAGQLLECDAGQCVGELLFVDLPDAHVDRQQPDQNFGLEPILAVDGDRDAYLELPNLGLMPLGVTIHSAALHLSCTDPGSALDVYRIENSWDEQAMTSDNAPGLGNARLLTFSPRVGENVLELVGLLPSWQVGMPNRSLGLTPASNAGPSPDPVEFSSREGGSPPYLVLSVSW
ncbi:MAG: DNRLRE domain-containing protein [Enhygromyxa sp.]